MANSGISRIRCMSKSLGNSSKAQRPIALADGG